jgi:hypothetical protein
VRPPQVAQRRVKKPVQFPSLRYESRGVEAITLWNALRPSAYTEVFRSVCNGSLLNGTVHGYFTAVYMLDL